MNETGAQAKEVDGGTVKEVVGRRVLIWEEGQHSKGTRRGIEMVLTS